MQNNVAHFGQGFTPRGAPFGGNRFFVNQKRSQNVGAFPADEQQRMPRYRTGKNLLDAGDFAFQNLIERFPNLLDRVKFDLGRRENNSLSDQIG